MSERPLHIDCRAGCGACCIAPSLSSSIPGMPQGKPAGMRCVQLSADDCCMLYGRPDRPLVCSTFPPMEEHCGTTRDEALRALAELERATR